ncbi:hypothetical protein QYF61_006226 [Mycteria americana]|uniref:Uncharacterized protein n=1 Tax=Mycteria americana TaxID=33587 RepID=A0AAN7S9M6_MYCAM|nr:hypothetical protein QYF61_006226 [Mycteria americana]
MRSRQLPESDVRRRERLRLSPLLGSIKLWGLRERADLEGATGPMNSEQDIRHDLEVHRIQEMPAVVCIAQYRQGSTQVESPKAFLQGLLREGDFLLGKVGFSREATGQLEAARLIAFSEEVDLSDEGRATDVVYVDFSKAFDTVSQTSS